MEEQIIFRSAKRRKFTRLHASSEEAQEQTTEQNVTSTNTEEAGDNRVVDSEAAAISNVYRVRKRVRGHGGVAFSNTKPSRGTEDEPPLAMIPLDEPAETMRAMSDRFVGHTGQPVNDDRHMMEYIDSKMAKRSTMMLGPDSKPQADNKSPLLFASDSDSYSDDELPTNDTKPSVRDPAALGQLQEVDLDPSLDTRPSKEQKPRRPRRQKIRLGRDGKPLKPRPRRRRPSEDIARDALVERILTENRIDHYDGVTAMASKNTQAGRNEDADERLAAQFRQDFLDSQAQRQQQQQLQQRNKAPTKDPGQKGPKLGGSRSQRAAMERARREKEVKDNPGK